MGKRYGGKRWKRMGGRGRGEEEGRGGREKGRGGGMEGSINGRRMRRNGREGQKERDESRGNGG